MQFSACRHLLQPLANIRSTDLGLKTIWLLLSYQAFHQSLVMGKHLLQ